MGPSCSPAALDKDQLGLSTHGKSWTGSFLQPCSQGAVPSGSNRPGDAGATVFASPCCLWLPGVKVTGSWGAGGQVEN